MALIVEDGTGKVDAESYASVAQFRDYHTKRGNDISGLIDADIEALLRKATDYIQQTYYGRWAGYRNEENQALDWPRSYVPRDPSIQYPSPQQVTTDVAAYYYPFNEIPLQLIQATCELALKADAEELLGEYGQVTKSEKVGRIEVEYDNHKTPNNTYPAIDRLLSRFMGVGTTGMSISPFAARLVRS